MKVVHVGLGVTDAQWSAFMTIISGAAAERGFGPWETQEFLALFVQQFDRWSSRSRDAPMSGRAWPVMIV